MSYFEKTLVDIMVKVHEGNGKVPHTLASLRIKGVTLCSSMDACCGGTRVEVHLPGCLPYVFECIGGSEGADMDDGSVLYYTHFRLV